MEQTLSIIKPDAVAKGFIGKIIDRFETKYVLVVLIMVPLFIASLYYFNGYSFEEAFYRGMVLANLHFQ